MRRVFKSKRVNALIPYFTLAVTIILAYKIISEIDVIFSFIKRIMNIINPFFYGFLLAYILNIPCEGIQRLLEKAKYSFIRNRKKILGIIITYLLFLLILFLVLRLIIPSVYNSIALFFMNFQTYYNSAQQFIDYINAIEFLNFDMDLDIIMSKVRDFSMDNLSSSLTAIFGVSYAIFKGFLAFISSIYILSEKEKFKDFLCKMLRTFSSDEVYNVTLRYSRTLNNNFKRYIYTQTIDGCILGTIATIELSILGSEYALTLGIMLGIVNYIPYFGSIIGSLVAVIVVAFTQNLTMALITAVVLLITQQLDGNFIQPKLLGGSFKLSPLLVIVSITIGGAFHGPLGMIAAIPIVAVLKDLLEDVTEYYQQKKAEEAKQAGDK